MSKGTALARTHHTARRKLRKRLEAAGADRAEIEAQVADLRARQGRLAVAQSPPKPKAAGPAKGERRKTSENDRKKRSLARRDGERCYWCGAALDITIRGHDSPSPPRATIDHVVPTSAGGPNNLGNLVLSCEPCNNERGGIHGPGAFPKLVGLPSRATKAPTTPAEQNA